MLIGQLSVGDMLVEFFPIDSQSSFIIIVMAEAVTRHNPTWRFP